jgi:hypothetical protein
MKKILLQIFLLAGIVSTSFAQTNSYGISVGIAGGAIRQPQLSGGPGYDLNTGSLLGLQYTRRLNNRFHLMTGIDWYHYRLSVKPNTYPGIDKSTSYYDFNLLSIPVYIKMDLPKHFFIDGGLIVDFDVTKDKQITNQSGIGVGLGVGYEVLLTHKVAIQLNPYFNLDGLILFDEDMYPKRVFGPGIKLIFVMRN